LGLKYREAENEEGLLRMPTIVSAIDPHEEYALQDFIAA
jgi:hypothetical protein